MTEGLEKIWAYTQKKRRVGIWRSDDDRAVSIEYTRSNIARAEADTLRAEVERLRAAADEMALAIAEPVTTHTTDAWLRYRQNCLSAYYDAKAHGEAAQ